MKPIVWSTILVVWGLSNVAWAQQWAQDLFQTKSHDFGTVAAGSKAEFAFVITNNTDQEVRIASVRSSCGCSDVRVENPNLKTYESGTVVASVNSERLRGRQSSTITVVLDRPRRAEVQLQIRVFIRGDLVVSPPQIGFGELPVGTSAERTVTLTRYGKPEWRILEAKIAEPHLTAEYEETERSRSRVTYRLKVQLGKQVPVGYLGGAIQLVTNDRSDASITVMTEGRVSPAISVAPAALFWGVVAPGQQATRQIVVRGKTPFKIVRASADCDCVQFSLPSSDVPKKLHLIPVTFTASGTERGMRRKLTLETNDGKVLELQAHAAVKGD